jgi:hypothetical protein
MIKYKLKGTVARDIIIIIISIVPMIQTFKIDNLANLN